MSIDTYQLTLVQYMTILDGTTSYAIIMHVEQEGWVVYERKKAALSRSSATLKPCVGKHVKLKAKRGRRGGY